MVAQHCGTFSLPFRMPLRRSIRKYSNRTVEFEVPLFPGYVFVASEVERARALTQTGHVARVFPIPPLTVPEFCEQLDAVEFALSQDMAMEVAPEIVAGTLVMIRYGPLAGTQAWVQERRGKVEVVLRLDFIGQGALLKVAADALEPI
jgi:transcription antitermination factor NusG